MAIEGKLNYPNSAMQVPQAPQGIPAAQSAQAYAGIGGMDMAQLQDYLATLSPQEQQDFLNNVLSDPNSMQDMHSKSMAFAEKLRETPTPEGRTTRNQIYTAANPLEHLSAGADKVMGAVQHGQAQDEYEEAEEMRQKALRQMGDFYMFNGGV